MAGIAGAVARPARLRLVLPALAAWGLAGCAWMPLPMSGGGADPASQLTPAPPGPLVATPAPQQRPGPARGAGVPDSEVLRARYARLEESLVARGLLRTDGGTAEPPVDAATLTRNFLRVALFDEFVPSNGRLVAAETASALRRWQDQVRIGLVFGGSVDEPTRQDDRATVNALARRLADVSGHPITVGAAANANLTVFVVDETERRGLGPELRRMVPGLSDALVNAVVDMAPTTFCMIVAFSEESEPFVYRRAFAVIRAEHPPLLRRSCFHEEIAQGLGLANDSPEARPSIFNDDEEFALLTEQDEQMLAILYDPQLRPGMSSAEAAPIVAGLAEALAGRREAVGPADPTRPSGES